MVTLNIIKKQFKSVIAFCNFIGNDNSFLDITKKDQILDLSFIK